jgi:hypothetical protein
MAVRLGMSGQVLASQAGHWFLADLLGMAIVAPFALSLTSVNRMGWKRAFTTPFLIGLVSFLLCWQTEAPVLFLAFPMVALAVINDRDRAERWALARSPSRSSWPLNSIRVRSRACWSTASRPWR